MAPDTDTLLAIYLNDHYAGSVVGVELARRARGSNRGTPLGDFLDRLVREIEEDREELVRVMDRVGAERHPLKSRLAWLSEKLGRLKPNGRLVGYSPLSRLVELESLSLGLEGKAALWLALARREDGRLTEIDFGALAARARRQREELEPFRIEAALEACGSRHP